MELETISAKLLNELEQHIREVLVTLRKAKLQHEPIALSLYELEQEIGRVRRERFDARNTEYKAY